MVLASHMGDAKLTVSHFVSILIAKDNITLASFKEHFTFSICMIYLPLLLSFLIEMISNLDLSLRKHKMQSRKAALLVAAVAFRRLLADN